MVLDASCQACNCPCPLHIIHFPDMCGSFINGPLTFPSPKHTWRLGMPSTVSSLDKHLPERGLVTPSDIGF